MTDAGPAALFDVEELAADARAGRVEAGLHKALQEAERDQLLQGVDAGLVGAALVAARALDRAERMPDKAAVYAIAQLLPPYQKALHGLGIPLERAPATGPAVPVPAVTGNGAPSWLGDEFGPS